ncbi:MAG TPA: ABC transporter ATP-binding protein [Pirellulales bacterium]|jgi:putative ABC transport system ATP-binding protein|nr:ABC transporter ATP-binding protein [Pirellulales bacterium]
MREIVVRAIDLSKSYRNGSELSPVLRGINLCVPRGECVFLVGPSGSGKTTLLSILGCVLSADAGRLQILGVDVLGLSPAEQARFRREEIGFVFQRFHLFNALTATENVCVPLSLLGWSRARSRGRAKELLSLVGLGDKASSRVTRLSMGQRQRVAFARALAGDPQLILADEPTASLDAEAGSNAMRVLKGLCRELGKTVLVVTHDSRIYPMADRILRLGDGRIVGEEIDTPSLPDAA